MQLLKLNTLFKVMWEKMMFQNKYHSRVSRHSFFFIVAPSQYFNGINLSKLSAKLNIRNQHYGLSLILVTLKAVLKTYNETKTK